MKESTRLMFAQLCVMMGQAYNVEDVTKEFTVSPSMEQTLQDKIVEQSEFLGKINVVHVRDKTGQVILGYASGPASGRVDTSGAGERTPKDLLGLDPMDYQLHKTNSDVYLRYDTIDAWARFKDLPIRYTGYVQKRIANDREIIGWYGESAAADTNLVNFPLMQDVNKGWMQAMRDNKAGNIITEGATAGAIRIGAGGDYANLDDAVSDMIQGIPKFLRAGLVVYVGDELVSKEHAALYKSIGSTPSEKVLATASMSMIGGLPWETPTNFPGRGLVITTPENLSIYVQEDTWRRQVEDNPKKDRIDDFNSRNEGYVVEVLEQFVALEFKDDNVKVPNAAGDGWE